MGKTSNRSDFGTEGNEGNKGPNDFVAQVGLFAGFLGFRTFIAASPSKPVWIHFGYGLLNFSFPRFLWRLDFWCLEFGSPIRSQSA
jgi:hypothetical protein